MSFYNRTGDNKVTEFLTWPTHKNIKETKSVIRSWVRKYYKKNFYLWVIVLKYNSKPIGTIAVVGQNEQYDMAHIGYCIGSKWWNKGNMSEAFAGIISFLFEQVKVNRIESNHDSRNPNSGKVMAKYGLSYEGTMRDADVSNKGIGDAVIYSLIAKDYFNLKKTSESISNLFSDYN